MNNRCELTTLRIQRHLINREQAQLVAALGTTEDQGEVIEALQLVARRGAQLEEAISTTIAAIVAAY